MEFSSTEEAVEALVVSNHKSIPRSSESACGYAVGLGGSLTNFSDTGGDPTLPRVHGTPV